MIPDQTNAELAPRDRGAIAEAVREMLRVKGLTLYQAAALTQTRYPQQPAYRIRRNFYFQLRSGLSPTLQQVQALSELTGSGLWDWLRVFGFSPGDIPRLQSILPRPRTIPIDKDLVDPQALLPFLRYRQPEASLPAVAPLSQLLERSGSCPAVTLMAAARGNFVYAKIGTNETLAFPELLPGSIVRADPQLVASSLPTTPGQRRGPLVLVEHSRGLNCGRLRIQGTNRVAFVTSDPSAANVGLRIGTEARILGVVDLELRFRPASRERLAANVSPISSVPAEPWIPARIKTRASQRPGALLETARLRAGLSLRSASKLSRVVARILGDHRYFASSGTLSDYEAGDKMPRHIHKLFTLAIVYSVPLRDLLGFFEIALDHLGKTTVTRETKISRARVRRRKDEQCDSLFETLRNQFGHLPLFLDSALPSLSGLPHIGLRDVFWLRGEANPPHPSLRGARFVLVNRRSKKPRIVSRMPLWAQPLYLLQERDGPYLAASCAIENDRLVLYSCPTNLTEAQPVRRHIDADVVGQIVGIARCLVSPP
jgi:transcriptional regulator with XRE-family HTH domain